MFKSKINGSFKEEYESPSKLISDLINRLRSKAIVKKTFYILLTALLALINIATIVLASFALTYSIENQVNVLTTGIIAGMIILTFVLALIISIYQGSMKAKVYKKITELIQEEVFTFQEAQGEYKNRDGKLLIKNVKKITKMENNTRNKITLSKALISALMGGNDE